VSKIVGNQLEEVLQSEKKDDSFRNFWINMRVLLNYPKNKICQIVDSLNKRIILLPCNGRNVNDATGKLPPDFEDCLLYEIALHRQLDYFITSNTKDFNRFQNSLLPVVNAKAFNKILGVGLN
jgi:hypothetical protein